MPGTTSDAHTHKDQPEGASFDSPRSWHTDTMKSTASKSSASTTESPSASGSAQHVEVGTEAREKEKEKGKGGSWVKNIGTGLRTLRLKKHADKTAIKMHVMESEAEPRKESQDTNGNASTHPTAPLAKEESTDLPTPSTPSSSASVSAAPPNVIPPFEHDAQPPLPPPNVGAKEKEVKKETRSLKRGWRKLGANRSTSTGSAAGAEGGGGSSGPSAEAETPAAAAATNANVNIHKADPTRFIGEGLCFKAKLIGVLEVSGPRGDRICQEALSELKMAVKAAGEHKQKVTVHVALDGLRLRDEKTTDCLYHHQVHKISFIAQDLTDSRAFGYIFGSPDTGHRFFGIKTDKSASGVVMAMRDLFQVVFDLKKKEIERAKQQLEMQQKFLATRAAENAPRADSSKSGRIAETYIEGAGACALPSPNSSRNAPDEADLLNLEVELSSLQEGLDNIHSNLTTINTASGSFSRGSTTSISSDPNNPSLIHNHRSSTSSTHGRHNAPNRVTSVSSTGQILDPFGDSFDPFDNRWAPSDPFSNIDPFPAPKPVFGVLEGSVDSDPFVSPPPPPATNTSTNSHSGLSFPFPPESQSHTNSSSRYAALSRTQRPESNHIKEVGKGPASMHWTASFEDNFVPESNGPQSSAGNNNAMAASEDGMSLEFFRDLDPLGSGRAKPHMDRKDFFQDLKNPANARRNLKDLYAADPTNVSSPPVTATQLQPQPDTIPNSFSTNFNPPSTQSTGFDFDSHFKIPAPASTSTASNSFYFANPTPVSSSTSTLPSAASARNGGNTKRSPQLLKRMTISTGNTNAKGGKNSVSPRASMRSTGSGKQRMDSSSTDEIPNLTPPPRPPHSTLGRNASIVTAVPRPHSGKGESGRHSASASLSVSEDAPEPPPRPLQTITTNMSTSTTPKGLGVGVGASLPLVSPPPLPPKKQPVFNLASLSANPRNTLNGRTSLGSRVSDSGSSNDLPLPLPSRKNGHSHSQLQETTSIPRYAVPPSFEKPVTYSPHAARKHPEPTSVSTSNLLAGTGAGPKSGLTMEQALSQVATLSLGQLASKLELPVEQLSALTIQQLAERLTAIDIKDNTNTRKLSTSSAAAGFETTFDDDFSTVSAPSTMEGVANRRPATAPSASANAASTYDKYAVFRELTVEDASGFSLLSQLNHVHGGSGSGSRTLTSRDSSSERTLQADDEPVATMDDVTDHNLSDAEETRSILLDEEGVDMDNYLDASNKVPQWATFDNNFPDQCIPLQTAFNKDDDSPSWDSDEGANNQAPVPPLPSVAVPDKRPKIHALKTTKIDSQTSSSSQFDFQPFTKPNPRIEDAIEEGESHLDPLVSSAFQRQSSGSSKHSQSDKYTDRERDKDRDRERGSDYSGGSREGRERGGSGRRLELPVDREGREGGGRQKDSRPSSYSSSGRKYSRGESDDMDEEYGHSRRRHFDTTPTRGYEERRRRRHYDRDRDEGGVENPSFDPTLAAEPAEDPESRARKHGRRGSREHEYEYGNDAEMEDDDDRSYSSRHSAVSPGSGHGHRDRLHHRRRPPPKYHGSLQRRHRYSPRDRRDFSPERYSNHESDFDSYEEDPRRGPVPRREREYYREGEYSRPSSSGSGRRSHHPPYHRGTSRDFYYREHRHSGRRDHRDRDRRRGEYDDPEDDTREASDYSEEEPGSGRGRRHRGRRPPPTHTHRHRDRDRSERYSNSASWESESPPPQGDQPRDQSNLRSERKRHSAGKGGRQMPDTLVMPMPETEPVEQPMSATDKEKEKEDMFTEEQSQAQQNAFGFDDNFDIDVQTKAEESALFPSSFDVDMDAEVELVEAGAAEGGAVLGEGDEAMEVKTPESEDFQPANPNAETKMLTMISEESHNSNSNSMHTDRPLNGDESIDSGAVEVEMKKSDSFNIFERESDPFAEDDFFK